ncbi:MAG: hypothetical protein JRN27_02350 [Nitrososphaerota archaeon]|nr:hypothetical protein [Nitrososphaerota archaeon]MDG6974925.1 hypothetical protein [Nitrososphaerota archaeon]
MTTLRSTLAFSAAGGLLLIDANFMVAFAFTGLIATATLLEIVLFGVQLAKTMALLAVKPLREAGPALLVDLYGADLFLLPLLLATSPLTGLPFASSAMDQVFRGWTAGVAFSGLPYAAYRIGRGMLRSSALTAVVPSGVVVSEISILMTNASLSAAASGTGLYGLVDSFLKGSGTEPPTGPASLVGMAVVYVSLLAYAVLGLESRSAIGRNSGLLAGLLATAGALAWAFGTSSLSLPPALLFMPPTLAMAAATWWLTRGH